MRAEPSRTADCEFCTDLLEAPQPKVDALNIEELKPLNGRGGGGTGGTGGVPGSTPKIHV